MQPAFQPGPVPSEVKVKQYNRQDMYQHDSLQMQRQGWVIQSMTTTTSRRLIGCLFGLIGYWLLPKRTIFHVTYVKYPAPPAPPEAPAAT